MEERRRVSRHRTFKSGKIVVHAGRSVFDCTVRNLSSEGALLIVTSLAGIPEKFDLVMETSGEHHRCQVVWRGENRLGVEFAPASAVSG
jgi:PilZ domain